MDPSILLTLFLVAAVAVDSEPPNPQIDMPGFLDSAQAAAEHRRSHRVSEDEFLAMMADPDTIVLDARSAQRYDELHVKGAVNLSFPDFTLDSLAQAIPDKGTRVLIYCNNNFSGAAAEGPFPAKIASASLNLSTFVALYEYGYRNVYELGPNVKLENSRLPFEGSLAD